MSFFGMAAWRRYRRPPQSAGLGRPSPAPSKWWAKTTEPEPDLNACFSTKSAALTAFVRENRQLIDEYGGVDYQVSPSEFDAINHKYDARARTIADALWAAMPSGKPFCLDRIDLETLNDTSPARQRDDAAFRLPDHIYTHGDTVAAEEARYYRDMEARTPEDAPREEYAPSSPRPTKTRRNPADDPATRAFVDRADEAADTYATAARDADWRPKRRRRKRRAAPIIELDWRRTRRQRSNPRSHPMTKRIDDSHQPFKRVRKIGPGPKRHPAVLEVKEWKCVRGKKPYTQICTWIGGGEKRAKTINRMNPRKKKTYNKLYRKWAAKNRAGITKIGRRPSYRCRKTRSTSCK